MHACREWTAVQERPRVSDAIFTRLRALLGTTGVERDPQGLPRATPDSSRRALAGVPPGP